MSEIGQLVQGRYELLELAGSGGMARVYRAVMRGAAGFQRMVALKRIREPLTDSTEFVRMFIEEARVCAELDHGNIVQVHDFGVDPRGFFLVMEWVDGLHLGQYMEVLAQRGQAMPWRYAVEIAAQVLAGLSAAHQRVDAQGRLSPIIHRDVTPQNVLLSVSGIAKLTDFGLARAMDRVSMTGPDVVKGKLSYLAPELVVGDPATVQSDLYSLGIVLWEALSGERLFWADTASERLRKVREAEIPRLATRRPSLPSELVQIVHRALAFAPSERFESAEAMQHALRLTLRERLVSARELRDAVIDARLGLGLSARSQKPPLQPNEPGASDVITQRVVILRAV